MSDFPNNRPLTIGSELGIYSHQVFPQIQMYTPCLSKGRTMLVDNNNLVTWWADEYLELVKYLHWVRARIKTASLCATKCLLLFLFKVLKQNYDNIHLPSWIKTAYLAHIEMFSATAAQRTWANVIVKQMMRCLCDEHQSVSWWVSNSSTNVASQWTVNIFQLQKEIYAVHYK